MFDSSSIFLARLAGPLMVAFALAGCGDDDNGAAGGAGLVSPPPASATADLYVFGDSLSDAGNLGDAVPGDLPAPFYMNRISNGPVIVDRVAQSQGIMLAPSDYLSASEEGTNYATSGSRAVDSGSIDLAVQLQSFAQKNDGRADPKDNFIIFIGGNDLLEAVGTPNGEAGLDAAAAEIARSVGTLALLGARNIFVFNAPDVGRTPKLIAQSAAMGDGSAARGSALTQYFNARLAAEIAAISLPGVTVTSVDIYGILNDLLNNASANGFSNATQGCYVTDALRFSDFCSNEALDSFVFFDDIHPSGKTHRLIGEAVVARIGPLLGR